MAYFLGTHLRDHKKLSSELSVIFGLNILAVKRICIKLGWNPKIRVGSLTSAQVNCILRSVNKNYFCNSELRKSQEKNIKALVQNNVYRGIRHVRKLPVRGQRTHTNANTVSKTKWGVIVRRPKRNTIGRNPTKKKSW